MTIDWVVIPASVVIALAATLVYVLLIYWIDRHEKEPLLLALATFVWGALPAVILSVVLEEAAGLTLSSLDPASAQFMAASVAAPVIEEFAKALALWGLFLFFRAEFDGVLDGIVYGALVGLGFAMTENIAYFLSSYEEGGWAQWLMVVAVRSLLFGLMHAFYTGLTGGALGWALQARSRAVRYTLPLLGLGAAMLAHGLHNGLLSVASETPLGMVAFAAVADWSGILLLAGIVVLAWRRERQVIAAELADEVALGTLTQEDYARLTSSSGRALARYRLRQQHGADYARRWSKLAQAAVELAFKKRQSAHSVRAQQAVPLLRQKALALYSAPLAQGTPLALQRFCPSCGHPWRAGQRFCTHCGRPQRGMERSQRP